MIVVNKKKGGQMSSELRDRDGYCFLLIPVAEELVTGSRYSSGAVYRLAEEEQRRGHMS